MAPRTSSLPLAAVGLLATLLVGLPPKLPAQAADQQRLDRATETLLADDLLATATVSLAAVEVESGRVLVDYRGRKSAVPASVMKLTTTATALAELGSEYRFQTELCYTGSIVGDELRGDLVIVGGADPTLGAGRPDGALDLEGVLSRWVGVVREAGIRRIAGGVLADEGLLPGAEPNANWQWDDIGNYYGAGAGALVINDNAYVIRLQRTARVGDRPRILGVEPAGLDIEWTNLLRSGPANSGDQAYVFGAPGTYERVIRGTIPAGRGVFKVKGSLPDPALAAATWLREALAEAGVAVAGEAGTRGERVATAGTLDTYYSPRLADIARVTNFKSVNLYAEALYRALGRKWGTLALDGSADDNATGERLVGYWVGRGVDEAGWTQADGSGLSPKNQLTPLQLATVLRLSAGYGLPATVPRAGAEGTVRRLLRGDPRAARIRAKSGTLSNVRALAGYATRADGTEVAFAAIVNNHAGRGSAVRRALGEWVAALAE